MQGNWAVITGASSGIGKAFVIEHARRKGNAVIVARSEEKLNDLKKEIVSQYGVEIMIVVGDLTAPETVVSVIELIVTHKLNISILINNAGFGGYGKFQEREWKQDQGMIRLNIEALSNLTHQMIPHLNAPQNYILNVASTAGFMPGPLQATYFATKAFVVSFSQALDHELKDDNISVSALCPGPVDTNFGTNADMEDSPLFSNAVSPSQVAKVGYKRMLKRRRLIFNDWKMALAVKGIIPFIPSKMTTKVVEKMQKK